MKKVSSTRARGGAASVTSSVRGTARGCLSCHRLDSSATNSRAAPGNTQVSGLKRSRKRVRLPLLSEDCSMRNSRLLRLSASRWVLDTRMKNRLSQSAKFREQPLHGLAAVDLQGVDELQRILVVNGENERRGRSLAEQIADGGVGGGGFLRQIAERTARQLGREDDMVGFRHAAVALRVDGTRE